MTWIWVLAFSVLGSQPEHGAVAKFETRAQCQQALEQKRQEMQAQGKQIAAHCYLSSQSEKGWWK